MANLDISKDSYLLKQNAFLNEAKVIDSTTGSFPSNIFYDTSNAIEILDEYIENDSSLHTDSLTQLVQDYCSEKKSFSCEASASVAEMRQNENRFFENEEIVNGDCGKTSPVNNVSIHVNDISQNWEQTEISEIPEVRTRGRKRKRTLKNKEQAKVKRARDKHPLRESCSNSYRLQYNTKISQFRRHQIWTAFWKLSYNERKALMFQCITRQYPKNIKNLRTKSKQY